MPRPARLSAFLPSGRPSGAAAPALLLSLLLFLPPVLPFLLNAPSFMVGTLMICVLSLIAYAGGLIRVDHPDYFRRALMTAAVVAAFALAHLAVCYMFHPVALGRALQTLPIIIVFLAATPLVISVVIDKPDSTIDRAVLWVVCCYILFALLSIVGVQPPGYYGEKPTFPFTEPSFLAFTIAPVLIYFCVTRSFFWRWTALAAIAGFAVTVSNLTTLATSLVVMVAFARWWQIGAALLAGVLMWPYVDQDYFLDRLNFDVDSVNITALVYVQGWQLLDESLRTTQGWGLGVQQLGAGYTNTIASYRINQLMGRDVNLLDGGFLLAKMGSEFGIFGLAALAGFTGFAGIALLRLRAVAQRRASYPRSVLLCYASVVGSVVEIYLRGSTYFTGTMLLLASALLYLIRDRVAQRAEIRQRMDEPATAPV